MTEIANYDIKYTQNKNRIKNLKEAKWEQMKLIKKALTTRKNADNMVLSSLLKSYELELNMEISQIINLIDIFNQLYIKNETLLQSTQDKIQIFNLSTDILIIKEELDQLTKYLDRLNKYKL